MAAKSYMVKLRITGWAEIEVEADSAAEAIEDAKDRVTIDDLNDWEPAWSDREHQVECLDEDEDEDEDEEEGDFDE